MSLLIKTKEPITRTIWLSFLHSVAFLLVACTDPSENVDINKQSYQDVKTITTRYISHQSDTYDKDDKIVSIARFFPDQTIESYYQYTTYPYTSEKPKERDFWGEIELSNLPVIMDGLTIGYAERNFLYGNDWPKYYAETAEAGDHYKYRKNREGWNFNTTIEYIKNDLPKKINIERELFITSDHTITSGMYTEEFNYKENKVSKFYSFTKGTNVLSIHDDINYNYLGSQLAEMTDRNKTYKFLYDAEGRLKQTQFYLDNKMYNYRDYTYNKAGHKTRSEIYNVNGDPEYTILYEYEFYQ